MYSSCISIFGGNLDFAIALNLYEPFSSLYDGAKIFALQHEE